MGPWERAAKVAEHGKAGRDIAEAAGFYDEYFVGHAGDDVIGHEKHEKHEREFKWELYDLYRNRRRFV